MQCLVSPYAIARAAQTRGVRAKTVVDARPLRLAVGALSRPGHLSWGCVCSGSFSGFASLSTGVGRGTGLPQGEAIAGRPGHSSAAWRRMRGMGGRVWRPLDGPAGKGGRWCRRPSASPAGLLPADPGQAPRRGGALKRRAGLLAARSGSGCRPRACSTGTTGPPPVRRGSGRSRAQGLSRPLRCGW